MWHQILYFLQNLVIPLRCSPTRRGAPRSDVWKAESPTNDETSMAPLKCEWFGSAAQEQSPPWVHTGLTASSMNVKCHTKHENRASLYCSFSSHQKSVFADDKSKHNKPSPSSLEPTSWLWLCTLVTAAAASAIAASQSPQHMLCVFLFYIFRGEKRRSLRCSSSSHQKSVSADDKSKHNKPSPSSPEPTSWLWLCTWVTAAAASAIAASQSPPYMLCAC